MVGGVCGGLGEYLDLDPTVVRVLFLIATFVTGVLPMLIAYIVMMFVIPKSQELMAPPPAEPPSE